VANEDWMLCYRMMMCCFMRLLALWQIASEMGLLVTL